MYFYDLNIEEAISILNECPYNPISSNKMNRKLQTLVNNLNAKGYEVGIDDIDILTRKGMFGSEYWVRVYNPHFNAKDDDDVYFEYRWFTL